MKKLYISAVLCFMLLFAAAGAAYAQQSIVETPEVKIIIDGKIGAYSDVPLSVDERTMLPLRELLVNLGVKDDNEHIIWNGDDKSVTILKDDTEIYLQQGNTTAKVNGKEVQLDIAPLGYSNGRTYIPARFVSEALGKKVVWDGSAKAVLIRNAADYDHVKQILDKSNAAMKSLSKAKIGMKIDYGLKQNGLSMNFVINGSGELDKPKKLMHMLANINMLGMDMKVDYFYNPDYMYFSNPVTGEWQRMKLMKPVTDSLFGDGNQFYSINADEPLYAGLVEKQSANPDEILLAGDVYMDEFFRQASQLSGNTGAISGNAAEGMQVDRFYMELAIDRQTGIIKRYAADIEGTVESAASRPYVKLHMEAGYSDLNGDFSIEIPEDAIKNAVDIEETGAGNGAL